MIRKKDLLDNIQLLYEDLYSATKRIASLENELKLYRMLTEDKHNFYIKEIKNLKEIIVKILKKEINK